MGKGRVLGTAVLAIAGAACVTMGVVIAILAGVISAIGSALGGSKDYSLWIAAGIFIAVGLWVLGMALFRSDRKQEGPEGPNHREPRR